MSTGSNAKRNSARGKKAGSKVRIAEWSIEQTTIPDHVNVSFGLLSESDVGTTRSTTRRFLLHRDQAFQLISELKEALTDAPSFEYVKKQKRSFNLTAITQPGSDSNHAGVDDAEPLSDHFALGIYGLVGN